MLAGRRDVLRSGFMGAALLAMPAWARFGQGFTHNVASGEPSARSVLLWTRYVFASGAGRLTAELSTTPDFSRIAAGGSVEARPEADYTAKITITGLVPGQSYYYRFIAPNGDRSPVGRTRTLPEGKTEKFNLGVFSCSNLPFGMFNAYAHAAARDDIDLMLHLGDYIYEYGRGKYPTDPVAGRIIEPAGESIHLEDYRLRYASYRLDTDLQRIHQLHPMILMWDDHESANDSWQGGAENHDPATEGPWEARKRAAIQAYREWMPVSDAYWAEYQIGDLATIFRPETRLLARSHQLDMGAAAGDLKAFRDGPWQDAARTLMGPEQERWLADALRRSAHSARWQIFAQQVNVGYAEMPKDAMSWLSPGAPVMAQAAIQLGLEAAKLGLPFNMDSWNGYPAARSRMLRSALDANANLLVLSGDSHNAWAFDLSEQGTPAGVEFGGHSVTSPGYEAAFPGTDPKTVARGVVASSPELKWTDTAQRGYMTVALSPNAATAEWLFLDSIKTRSTAIASTHRETTQRGSAKLSA